MEMESVRPKGREKALGSPANNVIEKRHHELRNG